MLTYAFEVMGCQRVEFRTDALNVLSRAAIKRLGAVPEGTLRKHGVTASGRVRDTVVFSIVDDEWPKVKERLEEKARGIGQ
jgi:RimJ/RimL family protein N-acetyltransferase